MVQSRKDGIVEVDGVLVIPSQTPMRNLPEHSINIVSDAKAVTPFDFINDDGTLKKPVTERARRLR